MDSASIAGLIGGVIVATFVKASNIVIAWLARALDVTPPDPIEPPGTDTDR